MPKGPTLTRAEREEIAKLRAENLSARDIAKRIDRSKTVVLNYLKNPVKYGTIKRSGRKRALSKAQEEQLFRALSETAGGRGGGGAERTTTASGKLSAERIKQEFALPLSTRRVQQLLSDWRRSTRKALDQQHALVEDQEEQDEEVRKEHGGGGGSPSAAPSATSREEEIHKESGGGLLDVIPPSAPLVLEEDATLDMAPSATSSSSPRPTHEVRV